MTKFFPIYGDFSTDSLNESSAELRVTVPFTPRFAVEGSTTIGQRGSEFFTRIEGLYMVQIRQRLRHSADGAFQPFVTYGAAGYYAHVSQRQVVVPNPGGGVYTTPAYSYTEVDEPFAAVFGGGFQQRLGSRLALRADAQMVTFLYLPLGYRFSTSVSIPLGRYSTN